MYSRFVDVHQIENEMSEALEKKNFTKCNELFEKTKNMFDDLSSKPHVKRYVNYLLPAKNILKISYHSR